MMFAAGIVRTMRAGEVMTASTQSLMLGAGNERHKSMTRGCAATVLDFEADRVGAMATCEGILSCLQLRR
jgi:hypothetical protein